eukprot:8989406-Pyramimonas_sp.AAC.1
MHYLEGIFEGQPGWHEMLPSATTPDAARQWCATTVHEVAERHFGKAATAGPQAKLHAQGRR